MDGGAWWAAVHEVAKSRTRLSDFTFTFHFYALEKEMATHSSVLVWRIPGTEEPDGLPSMGSHKVRHDWSNLAAAVLGLLVGLFAVEAFSQMHATVRLFFFFSFLLIDQPYWPTLASLLMFRPTVKSVPRAPFIAEWWAALKLTGGEWRTTQGWTAVRHAVLHIKNLDNDLTHSGNIC